MADRGGANGRRKGHAEVDALQGVERRGLTNAAVAAGGVERKVTGKLVARSVRDPPGEPVVQVSHVIARWAMARTRSPNGPCAIASGAAAPYAAA
jgi:hypothetical protein